MADWQAGCNSGALPRQGEENMNPRFPVSSRQSHAARPRYCSALSLTPLVVCLAGCEEGGTGETSFEPDSAPAAAPLFAAATAQAPAEEMELVSQSRVQETDDREVVASDVKGEVDEDIRDRVARPYRFVNDPFLCSEEAWSRGGKDGVTERGYLYGSADSKTGNFSRSR
jgi:hypothetical protein